MKKILLFILICLFFTGCAVNPVTGRRELILVSKQQERAIGAKSDREIIRQFGLYKNKSLSEYIGAVFKKLLRYVHRRDVGYKLRILDSTQVNAFAVPGGYVYITRGLLAYLNNEAQLAGVLGHELGHINARHMAKQMTYSMIAQLGLNIGMIAAPELKQFSGLISEGVKILFLKFSRDDEYQADYLGVLYSSEAGYNAYEMGKFFNTLKRIEKANSSTLPEFLSTHPSPGNRINEIKQDIAKVKGRIRYKKLIINRDEYLFHINGMIFGKNPRDGFFEKGYFYHPELRFKFKVPMKWKLYNERSQVIAVSNKKDAIVVFHLSGKRGLRESVKNYLNNKSLITYSVKNLYINGFAAVRTASTVKGKNYAVISYFIDMRGKIYEFDCIYKNFNERYGFIPLSFSYLYDKNKINRKPKRIYVKTVRRGGSLRKILSFYGITDRKIVRQIAVLNGLEEYDHLGKGLKIKIIK